MKKHPRRGEALDYHQLDFEEVGPLPPEKFRHKPKGIKTDPEERERRRLIKAKRKLAKQTEKTKWLARPRRRDR